MLVVLLCLGTLRASSVEAADVIYLRQPGSETAMPLPATIDDFTGRFIQFRTSSSTRPRSEPTSLVERVEHDHTEGFKRAASLFEKGQLESAEAEWRDELNREPKPWVQREICSWLIRAAWRQGHWGDAGNQFLSIAAEDPDTFHWPIAPLLWAPQVLRDEDRATALRWLGDSRPEARLLGASLLLKDAVEGDAATRALTALTRETSSQIAGLAKAQLWRNRLAQPISDNEIASWRSHVAFLPETLRGGPQFVLGSGYLRRGQFDRAAAELLWVPLIYSQHEPTAARASLDAGEALLRGGRRDEGLRLLNETAEKYPWSVVAREARSRIADVERASQ